MPYVDGYVIPLPRKAVKAYVKMAKAASQIWIDHGALEFRECVGDDLKTPYGTPFTKRMKLKPSEMESYYLWSLITVHFFSTTYKDGIPVGGKSPSTGSTG